MSNVAAWADLEWVRMTEARKMGLNQIVVYRAAVLGTVRTNVVATTPFYALVDLVALKAEREAEKARSDRHDAAIRKAAAERRAKREERQRAMGLKPER